jgi:hypothetical protein
MKNSSLNKWKESEREIIPHFRQRLMNGWI